MDPLIPDRGPVVDISAWRVRLSAAGFLPPDTLAAFCVGSVARGWATPTSDVDIYVVTDEPFRSAEAIGIMVPLHPDVIWAHNAYADGQRWEIKYWTNGQIDQMLGKVSTKSFDSGEMIMSLTAVEEGFLERILTCLVITGEPWVAACRDKIRNSAYREFVVSRSLTDADKAAENAIGQLAGNDIHGAVLSAHTAMRHTVDALLDSVECYGTVTSKWRARRMRDAAPAVLPFDQYWAMETMADLDRGNPEPWVQQVISWCKQMTIEIEV